MAVGGHLAPQARHCQAMLPEIHLVIAPSEYPILGIINNVAKPYDPLLKDCEHMAQQAVEQGRGVLDRHPAPKVPA
jgi:hypothetical protein